MKYSCCRSVTSNVLINFQLVTLIESNVYCLATIQAGRVRVETDGTTKRRACVQQPCFYLCNKQRPKGQLKSSQVYPFRACIRMCISNFWWNTLPCSNTDTKCIVSSRQYHEEEAGPLCGKVWNFVWPQLVKGIFWKILLVVVVVWVYTTSLIASFIQTLLTA